MPSKRVVEAGGCILLCIQYYRFLLWWLGDLRAVALPPQITYQADSRRESMSSKSRLRQYLSAQCDRLAAGYNSDNHVGRLAFELPYGNTAARVYQF
jgi:hypothetical protein